jgi:MATE family multidrug resistance protein
MFRGVGTLLRLGLPAALAIGFEIGVFNLSTALAGTLNPVSLAAHTIALNADAVAYMVPLGISSAAAVSVGRAIGAGGPRRAARAGWLAVGLGGGFEVFPALVFVLFGRQIAGLYTHDPAVVGLAVVLFRVAAVFQIFDGVQIIETGALRGKGNTRTPMIWNLVGYWCIGLPIGYFLCFVIGWGVVGIWDGLCLALILIGLGLSFVWWRANKNS